MSGPKISVYDLTGWARRVVVGQMQCEQQGLLCGEQIKELLAGCSGMDKELDKALVMLGVLQRKYGGQEETIREIQTLQQSMDQEIKRIQSEFGRNIPRVSPKYVISEEALDQKKRELEKLVAIKNQAQTLKEKLDKAAKAGKEAGKNEQKKTHQVIADYLNSGDGERPGALEGRDLSTLASSIAEDISGVFSFDTFDAPEEDHSFDDRKKAIRHELTELLKLELSKDLLNEIRNAISNLDGITQAERLSTFDSITVKKISRDLEAYQLECERKEAEFREALLRYQMLCDMAGRLEERDVMFSDEDALEEAITEMEKIVVKQKEQAYIADCVDEVMQDMGYDLIGHRQVRKKSGKQFKNELYQFGEGTAVNITYSPEGQISMELGGIAREDRIPTAEETDVLTRDMESFCGEFAEFERRMNEKGVIVGNRIALMPPTADYAAIINVSDYEMESGKQVIEMNVTQKRKKGTGAQQVLRRGE